MHFTAINGIQPNIPQNVEEILDEPEQPAQQNSPKSKDGPMVLESVSKDVIATG